MAALESLLSKSPDEFEAGEMEALLKEGEGSIKREGTLDVDEAFKARRARREPDDEEPSEALFENREWIGAGRHVIFMK